MLKIENTEVMGWEHAIRGMRNPKNSWEKSDSGVCATHGPAHCADCVYTDCHADDVEIGTKYILGGDDLTLMTTLRNAGTDHRKFMRRSTCIMANTTNPRRNAEGYSDPTAYEALKNIEREEDERFHRLLHTLFYLCELADFEIEGRIILVDKRNGRVWR